jgi:hypothetical protein
MLRGAAGPDVHTHRHVLGRPCEGTRARADELTRDAKVAQLDDALSREQDIGRLDIAVDDLLGVQVCETLQDLATTTAVAPRDECRKVKRETRADTRRGKGRHTPLLPRHGQPSLPRGPCGAGFAPR